jgi:hypothetical protein
VEEIPLPEAVRGWADLAAQLGFVDFLSAEDRFQTCLASGRPWQNRSSCGVYFWIAQNGETYVGETLTARGRLLEHLRNHPDLSYACFQPVHPENRKEREADLIEHVNSIFPTRNIKLAIRSDAHVPFDDFVSETQRESHLRGAGVKDAQVWRDLPVLSQKHGRKYDRFLRHHLSQESSEALFTYVSSVLPCPRVTEGRFWSVSLFVGPHLVRVNAGHQEIFTLSEVEGALYARPLTMVPFEHAEGPRYQTRSYDHWMLAEDLANWLTGDRLLASRELAVSLMRHTTTLNSGSHCPQVVRAAYLTAMQR